jgi:hypothetical protein
MPEQVWYRPLWPLTDAKVGLTLQAQCAARGSQDGWTRAHENSSFYGHFRLNCP